MFECNFLLHGKNIKANSVVVFGNCKELGGGDPLRGVRLRPVNGYYNFAATVRFHKNPAEDHVWYRYAFKSFFGGFTREAIPPRFIPSFPDKITLTDEFNKVSRVSSLVVRFKLNYITFYGQELYVTGNVNELGDFERSQAVQLFYSNANHEWIGDTRISFENIPEVLRYRYFVNSCGTITEEPGPLHEFYFGDIKSPAYVEIADTYRWVDQTLEVMEKDPFVNILSERARDQEVVTVSPIYKTVPNIQLQFSVHCPTVLPNQKLGVCGSISCLGNWDPKKALILSDSQFPVWRASVVTDYLDFEYKYVLIDGENVIWEPVANRKAHQPQHITAPTTLIISDYFILPTERFIKGTGISITPSTFDEFSNAVALCIENGYSYIHVSGVFNNSSFLLKHTLSTIPKDATVDAEFLERHSQWLSKLTEDEQIAQSFLYSKFREIKEFAALNRIFIEIDMEYGADENSFDITAFPEAFDTSSYIIGTKSFDYNWDDILEFISARSCVMRELADACCVRNPGYYFYSLHVPLTATSEKFSFETESIGYTKAELEFNGLWDIERLTKPYIRWHIIADKLRDDSRAVIKKYLVPRNWDPSDDWYDFKPEYSTENAILSLDESEHIKVCLNELLSNVVLFEDDGVFYFRKDPKIDHRDGYITYESSSWAELPRGNQSTLDALYQDFVWNRHFQNRMESAALKFDVLSAANNMLLIADDIEPMNEEFRKLIAQKGLLTTHSLQYPRHHDSPIDHPSTYEALSVASLSESAVRKHWNVDQSYSQSIWSFLLGEHGVHPQTLSDQDYARIIKAMHDSKSMFVELSLDDIEVNRNV